MASNFLPAISNGEGSFSAYLREINKIPSLTEEEEFSLAKRYHDYEDTNAAHKLVTSHLKLVAKIAMQYRGYGLPLVELVSEGNLGLMQAVKKFDYAKGFRLSTYAMWWIKASIQEYVLRSWSLVKIGTTAAQKKLFFNLGKIKRKIQLITSRDFNRDDYKIVAAELDVTETEVSEMNMRMNPDYSLDDPLGDSGSSSFLDILPGEGENQESIIAERQESEYRSKLLNNAMTKLNDREKDIIIKRKLSENPATLEKLSNFYKISKERIRQIEEKALEKIKAAMQTN